MGWIGPPRIGTLGHLTPKSHLKDIDKLVKDMKKMMIMIIMI